MKYKLITYIGLILTLTNCASSHSDLKYKPKSSDEFYFPVLSEKFKNKQEDCIAREKFPCNFPEPNDTLNDFENEWYSKHLKSLKETIIYKMKNENLKILRFTHLGTWSNPYSYTFENRNGQIKATFNKTKGLGGYQAGRRISHKEKTIQNEKWNQIVKNIESVNFWKIQTHDPNMILDGEEWILEVLIDGKYHFVTRNSPTNYGGKEYAELCKLIIKTFEE